MSGPVGIAGCGSMGSAIARRLLSAGHRVRACDIRPSRVAALARAGAIPAPGPAALARCPAVLLSLPSHEQVARVCHGPRGLLARMPPGALLINLTTGSVLALPALAGACAAAGVRYVTAPVSQAVDGAAAGQLTAFAHGEQDAMTAARPLLSVFCSAIIELGSHGTAMAAKLITNLAWYIATAGLPEVMVLAARAGIPPGQIAGVLAASCGDSWGVAHDIPRVLDGTYDPSFTTGLCVKDLTLIAELATQTGVPSPMTAAAAAVFRRAALRYGPGAPELSPVRHLEEQAGVSLTGQPQDRAAG